MSSSDRPVLIQAADGCSELYLVDDKFEVVASGVGHLYVQVSPGLYKVRQRIGDNERSQVVEVERSDGPRYGDGPMYVALPALSFASPIPLQGTNTSREFQQAALGQTGTTAAGEGTGRISLLVRDSRWEMGGDNNDRGEFLTGEVSRLSLGSLDGTFDRPLQQLGQVDIARGFFRASIDVAPGHYVLTQSTSEGLQHCLPLEVRAAWVPQVFLRIAQLGGSTQPQTLDLDHASIVYAGPGEQLYPSNPDLLLLEVVRKAFARRRTDIGADFLQELLEGKYRNPMLGLIGSHLLLDSAEQDKTRMKAVVDNTSALLGEDFPDIIALRLRLAARTDTPPAQGLPTVTSPPLLAASWAALTRQTGNDSSKRTAMDVARLFWFPCTVESTSTWFVWTEARNARRPTIPVPRSARGMSGDVRDRGLTISLRNVEYETPTSAEHVQKLVEELLADGGLQDWVRSLKSDARNVGTSGSTLNQLDRGLLTAIASAQAGLVPGVIDAQSAASRLVQNLNVPLTTAGRSASTLLSQIPRPAARSDKHPNASNTNQSGLGGSLDEPD